MNNEVEDFLRRVAQLRQQAEAQTKGQQQARAAQAPKPQRQQPPRPQSPQQQAPAARQQRPLPPAVDAEIVDAELADRSDRVSRLVDSDMRATNQIADHAGRLGAELDLADEKLEAHLQQVFDHKLGSLRSTHGDAANAGPDRTIADDSLNQIRRLLTSPSSVRNAVIMAEILRRPDF